MADLKPSELKNITKLIKDFVKSNSKFKLRKFRDYIVPFPIITKATSYPGAYVKNPLNNEQNGINISETEEETLNEDIILDELEEDNNIITNALFEKSVIDLDAASLYPTIVYSFNASPETLLYLIPERIASVYIKYKEYILFSTLKNQKRNIYNEFKNIEDVVSFSGFSVKFSYEEFIEFIYSNKKGLEFLSFLQKYLAKNKTINVYDFEKMKMLEFADINEFLKFLYFEIEEKERPIATTGAVFYNVKETEGVVRDLIKIPIIKRNEIKNLMKTAADPLIYEDKNKLYKLIANSIYGFLGFKRSRLFNVFIATTITIQGRIFIKYVSGLFNMIIANRSKRKSS